jgi:hypothetical protein
MRRGLSHKSAKPIVNTFALLVIVASFKRVADCNLKGKIDYFVREGKKRPDYVAFVV